MDCCINDLGRFSHNLKIETGLIATQAGEHYLFMNSASGGTFTLTKSLAIGEQITIEIGQLNESMVYNFKVGQPDGTNFKKDDCENFRLQTIINSQIDGCANPCDDNSTYNYGI